jgi:hypothetical protein
MIFRRSYTINTSLSKDEIRDKLIGQHVKVHGLDFEVMDKGGIMKVIPHTELAEEKVYTLPITHLLIKESGGKTKIKMKSKPRRIDIGGPTIALFFILFMMIAGVAMLYSGETDYTKAAYGMIGIGLVLLLVFALRMGSGYFDYIKKIKSWVKSQV